jgi:hypothetical protein
MAQQEISPQARRQAIRLHQIFHHTEPLLFLDEVKRYTMKQSKQIGGRNTELILDAQISIRGLSENPARQAKDN